MPLDVTALPADSVGADAVERLLARVVRRTALAHVLGSLAAAMAAATLTVAVTGLATRSAVATTLAAAGLAGGVSFWRLRSLRTFRGAARLLERAEPQCRNVVITAEELLEHPGRTSARMRDRVLSEAAGLAGAIGPARAVPLGRPASLSAAAAILLLAVAAGLPRYAGERLRGAVPSLSRDSGAARADSLTVRALIQPPGYTGLQPRELTNPDRIETVQGSRLRLTVSGPADAWRIRFGRQPIAVTTVGSGTVADALLNESGYVAIEPAGAVEGIGIRRLIGVAVIPDRAPVIRIDAPGRDLLLPDVTSPVSLSAAASDDYGLQSFELRYTKVSGSGEQFEFVEGQLPLAVSRETDRAWKGQATIALSSLQLEPGDSLVYRAVARDRRPGDAGFASSDTYFVEIAGPGQVALDGFALPPDQARYALSQQMIVLKLQRLHARERTLGRQALEEQTAIIAAEQRAVRGNFIFLMGGHVEDEEVEAEQSHEIQEGRLANTARQEITAAVDHMSRVEQRLAAVDAGSALPPAKAAVEALQRAFGRNRYILRTLPVRSRVDPARRLTGDLSAASDWRREVQPAALNPETRAARALLATILDVAADVRAGRPVDAAALGKLAEAVLAMNPGAADWQQAARHLSSARDSVGRGRPASEVIDALNAALAPVLARAQRGARPPASKGTLPSGTLLSAWAEEARR